MYNHHNGGYFVLSLRFVIFVNSLYSNILSIFKRSVLEFSIVLVLDWLCNYFRGKYKFLFIMQIKSKIFLAAFFVSSKPLVVRCEWFRKELRIDSLMAKCFSLKRFCRNRFRKRFVRFAD